MLTVISLVATINGLLTWIGKGFGIHQLTLQLILRYVFYPVTFFIGVSHCPFQVLYYRVALTVTPLGVPRNEILRVAELLATKLVENEFVAYSDLKVIMASDNPLSMRGFTIAALIQQEQYPEANYKKRLFKILPAYYLNRVKSGFPKYRGINRTLWVEIKGLLSGYALYVKQQGARTKPKV